MITQLLGLLGTFDPILASQFAAQILLALFLGGVIGLERERQRMPAGVRTFMLVSVGSCLFTILSYRGFLGGDPGRVAAQIVSGIGFLGAGVTIQRKGTIYGLTSAAGVWTVAAIGMAVGTGKTFLAVFSTVAVFVVMGLFRRWFKADVALSTRRTLNTALREVRRHIAAMGDLVERALKGAIQAVIEDDHNLALQVLEEDERINELRYRAEEECLDILRKHHPAKIQLRTVLAATHIATNLERTGDYAKEIARIRLQIGHEALPEPIGKTRAMVEQVCDLLQQILTAFAKDDVKAAQKIREQVTILDREYEGIVEAITEKMGENESKPFEQGAYLLNIAYYMRRAGERVINIAERIIFVRTGALAELDRDD